MKKIKVYIEETTSDTFIVEAETTEEAMEIARQKYENGEFVLEPQTPYNKMMAAYDEEADEVTDWVEF